MNSKYRSETFFRSQPGYLRTMESHENELCRDVREIKVKLVEVQGEIRRFMERSNQAHIEAVVENLRQSIAGGIKRHLREDAIEVLDKGMVSDCRMMQACKSIFVDLLQKNADIMSDEPGSDAIQRDRQALQELRGKAPYPRCNSCFSEAQSLLERQIDLLGSMRIYRTASEDKKSLSMLPEELIVSEMLDPLSNTQRLQIMKSLSIETKTFSELSKLTGLRGGNLLYHLTKLLEKKMILQRHDRGDYMLTEKGFKALSGLAEIYSTLSCQHSRADSDRHHC